MNNEYIIVNKTAIQKRIEELEKIDEKEIWEHMEFDTLKHILSQSTPLIPEIKKAYNYGVLYSDSIKKTSNDYISNLKLDV